MRTANLAAFPVLTSALLTAYWQFLLKVSAGETIAYTAVLFGIVQTGLGFTFFFRLVEFTMDKMLWKIVSSGITLEHELGLKRGNFVVINEEIPRGGVIPLLVQGGITCMYALWVILGLVAVGVALKLFH